MRRHPRPLVFLHVRTTGGPWPSRSQILDIGAIRVNEQLEHEASWSILVRPTLALPDVFHYQFGRDASLDSRVIRETGVPLEDALVSLSKALPGADLVGWRVGADVQAVRAAYELVGMAIPHSAQAGAISPGQWPACRVLDLEALGWLGGLSINREVTTLRGLAKECDVADADKRGLGRSVDVSLLCYLTYANYLARISAAAAAFRATPTGTTAPAAGTPLVRDAQALLAQAGALMGVLEERAPAAGQAVSTQLLQMLTAMGIQVFGARPYAIPTPDGQDRLVTLLAHLALTSAAGRSAAASAEAKR